MWVLALILFGLFLIFITMGKRTGFKVFRFIGYGVLLLGLLAALSASLVVIPAGHVGVPVVFGDVSSTIFGSGLHLKNPVANVVKVSVQERAYTMGVSKETTDRGSEFDVITVLTNEGMKVDLNVTVQYHIKADKVPWILNNKVWTNIDQYETDYVRPEVRRAIRDVCADYSGAELYAAGRGKVSEEIRKLADTLIAKNGATCVALNLRNVQLPAAVTAAIERKKEREQQNQEYDYKLQIEAKEAERKRIEAAGIRDFQITVSEGINPMLIQWKGIEAAEKLSASANTKVIVFGNNKIPLILGEQ
jgi:regulator of protease activity HflC (stomatin/prohibitin superfamily)